MKPILVVDNYDSFTYNLVHLLESVTDEPIVVKRNDDLDPLTWEEYGRLLLSPGPGIPEEAGSMLDLLRSAPDTLPILGVCLGMQALAIHRGGKLFQLPDVQHGIENPIRLLQEADRLGLYRGLPGKLTVGRYHSWMVDKDMLPPEWTITSLDDQNRAMSMVHASKPWQGVQYHPESVMTPEGRRIVQNWLSLPPFEK